MEENFSNERLLDSQVDVHEGNVHVHVNRGRNTKKAWSIFMILVFLIAGGLMTGYYIHRSQYSGSSENVPEKTKVVDTEETPKVKPTEKDDKTDDVDPCSFLRKKAEIELCKNPKDDDETV